MRNIQMKRVESSNIDAIGYEAESETLRVSFKSGAVWDYHSVQQSTYDAFMGSSSKGKFFNSKVRGVHTSTQV